MLTNTLHWSEVRKATAASGGTVRYCLGFADKWHPLRQRKAESSVPKLQAVSWRQRKSYLFSPEPLEPCRSTWGPRASRTSRELTEVSLPPRLLNWTLHLSQPLRSQGAGTGQTQRLGPRRCFR